jgi:Zn ribbon nucleic-acid-binding protein
VDSYNFWNDYRKELNIKECPECGFKMGGRLLDGRWLYLCEHCVHTETPADKDFTNKSTKKSICFKRYKIKKKE